LIEFGFLGPSFQAHVIVGDASDRVCLEQRHQAHPSIQVNPKVLAYNNAVIAPSVSGMP
jgi:hypothetical protein